MSRFITIVTEETKKEHSYINQEVFDKLTDFKKNNNTETIEMFQSTSGNVFSFYIYPPVDDKLIDELSDYIDEVIESGYDAEEIYCAFAFNKIDRD